MKPPITYAEWIDLFDRFEKGEDVFEQMNSGHFEMDAGTAQRFFAKAEKAFNVRKKMWLDQYQRNFKLQDIKTIEELEFVLQNNKKTLSVLCRFIYSKGLPEELKDTFQKDFTAFVSEFKKTLKDNTGKGSREREKMLMVINNFSISGFSQDQSGGEVKSPSAVRKIIF